MQKEELWQTALLKLKTELSQANFSTWFSNVNIIGIENNTIQLSAPNNFVKEWIENKYSKKILKIIKEINENISSIKLIVKQENLAEKAKKTKKEKINEAQLTIQGYKINPKTNLNPKYSFNDFIVGGFNQLAFACCEAIIEKPFSGYNPLFIYGGVGLGKTHLLQATGNTLLKKYNNLNIKYIQCERLVSTIINAIRNQNIEQIKNSFLDLDVFIVDDIQFLAGKEKTQEEFFHLFNFLYERNKQIIISSDKPPKDLSLLEERLKSRFEGGMIADISMPDFETRVAIIKTKCKEKGLELSSESIEYIAESIKSNIRKLEGAVTKILAYKNLVKKEITTESIKNIIKNYIGDSGKASFQKIIKEVCETFDIKEKDLLSETRKKEVVLPRQLTMFLLREELGMSYPLIGRKFNGKDHTTVMHACKKIEKEIKENDKLLGEIELIKQKIYA